jgi:peptidoglycan/xylan/chitin deacetylase (PgdA/CDA1 family)
VVAAQACPDSLAQVKSAGHEIGCHTLQHESLGEPLFDVPGIPPVLPEEVPNRLTKATLMIEQLSGIRPVSFRAPRGWASNEMLVTLDRLGYLVDSSYMAYYFGEHLLPYHPSAQDWRQPGELTILEVPLFGDLTVQSADPYRRDRDQWPMLRMKGAGALAGAILRGAEMLWAADKPALACIYLHPWEFVEMPRVIKTAETRIEFDEFLWKNTGSVALRELDSFIGQLGRAGAQFHTLRDFHDLWATRHHSYS